MPADHLIFDWNREAGDESPARGSVELVDETLRDGLQSPSASCPEPEEMLRLLRLIDALGIDWVDIGLPGAGPRQARQVERLAREIASARLRVRPVCAARTVEADIRPVVEISQRTGVRIAVGAFIGSSPIRQTLQGWDRARLVRLTEEAVRFAVREGLPVVSVTEDTTRAHPKDLRALYGAAIQAGASRVCVCDTVGHATPAGTEAVVRFVAELVERENPEVRIEWHGHEDRGLSVANALAALRAGAHAVHGCGLGIGERVGNTPMDVLLVNLRLLGWIRRDLSSLPDYVAEVSRVVGIPVPDRYPVFGRDAFRTGSGVHADAILKALVRGRTDLADRVYSGVTAADVGREQVLEVGPMSGAANAVSWLSRHRLAATPSRVEAILAHAKAASRILGDDELARAVIEADEAATGPVEPPIPPPPDSRGETDAPARP